MYLARLLQQQQNQTNSKRFVFSRLSLRSLSSRSKHRIIAGIVCISRPRYRVLLPHASGTLTHRAPSRIGRQRYRMGCAVYELSTTMSSTRPRDHRNSDANKLGHFGPLVRELQRRYIQQYLCACRPTCSTNLWAKVLNYGKRTYSIFHGT